LLNSVGPVVLLTAQSMGVTRGDAALLDAFKDLPIAIVSFLVASMLPRLGLRKAMLIGVAAVSAGCMLTPLVATFWAIKFMFATIGAAFALVKVESYSIIGLVTEDERRHASFTNFLEDMFMVGVLAGYWLFSDTVDNANAQSLGWLRVYWVMAAAAIASFFFLASSALDESQTRDDGTARASIVEDFIAMWRLLAIGLVVVFLASAFLYVLIEQGIATWLPTFNKEVLKLPTSMSVGLAVILPASTAIGRLLSVPLIGRIGWYPVVFSCLLAIGMLMLSTIPLTRGLHPDPAMSWLSAPVAAYLIPLIGLFLAPIYPAINSAMLSALPKPRHAAMTGLIVIFSALGGAFGSFVTGRAFAAFDGQTAFILLLLPLGLLALCLWLFRHGVNK
jgi:MFS transporter, FHS family, glucose/mannose:H+ symporter